MGPRCYPPMRASLPGTAIALLAALAAAYAVLVQPVGCNQTAHYSLVQSLADGTPSIDRYHGQTCDKAYIEDRFYAAKAPGLALLTVPWYALLEAAGAVPVNPALEEGYPQAMLELPRRGVWQLHAWSIVVPALALVVLLALVAERLSPGTGWTAAAILGTGTLVLPFATDFFVHPLSAALGFAAFAFVFFERQGLPRLGLLALGGLLAGLAVVAEYPLALVAVAVGAYALLRGPRRTRAAAYAAGAVAGAAPLALFNLWAFGAVHRLPYENAVIDPGRTGHDVLGANDPGLFGIELPSIRVALELLVSAKGLLLLSPVLAVAALGLVFLYRDGRRAEAVLAGGLPLAFVAYNAGYWTPFGGFVPGPRFLVAAIPFLCIGLAAALRRFPETTLALAAASAGAMTVATAAEPMLGGDDTASWLRRWERGDFAHSVVTLAGGGHGWASVAPFLAATGLAATFGLAALRPRLRRSEAASAFAALAAWALILVVAPKLIGIDRAAGEWWGAAALLVLVVAVGLLVARARHLTTAAALPLAAFLVPGFADHTKWALAVAVVVLAAAVALELVRRGRETRASVSARGPAAGP